jgi:hypothetical protein
VDEDFDLLLDALIRADAATRMPLLLLVTGRGPGRAGFEARLASARRRRLHVATRWLSPEECPLALAASVPATTRSCSATPPG